MGLHSEGLGKGTTFFAQFPLLHREMSHSWIGSETIESILPSSVVPKLPLEGLVNPDKNGGNRFSYFISMTFTVESNQIMDPRLRFLIVDDAIACRKMVIRIVKEKGYSYVEAKNGKDAVEAIMISMENDLPFDCVLMDSTMPVMSGPEATTAIRKLGFKGKIFGITGNTLVSDIDDFVARGLDEIFLKPLRPQELLSVLAKEELHSASTLDGILSDRSMIFCNPLENEAIVDDFKPRVLIVDDALPCRKMVIRILENQCQYSEARNGKEAVESVLASMERGLPYHYVLMDSSMPTMSGPEATRIIRSHGYNGKILGVTGNVQKSDLDSFLACGLNGILTKPLSPNDLFSALEISSE